MLNNILYDGFLASGDITIKYILYINICIHCIYIYIYIQMLCMCIQIHIHSN